MKKQQLLLYRIGNKGLELLIEKKRKSRHHLTWQLPEITLTNLSINNFCQNLMEMPIQLEYMDSVWKASKKCIAIEQSHDLLLAIKKKIIPPFFVKNGLFLSLKDVNEKPLSQEQRFFIKELVQLVSERRALILL